MTRTVSSFGLSVLALCSVPFWSPGCGRKAAPRPPEDVLPRTLTDLAASNVADGVQLSWSRPQEYTDGARMTDLGGFFIERTVVGAPAFERIAQVEVSDRDRFRQIKRLKYIDRDAVTGVAYSYRVVSFTVDGYFSAPSNAVTIERTPSQERNAPLPAPQR